MGTQSLQTSFELELPIPYTENAFISFQMLTRHVSLLPSFFRAFRCVFVHSALSWCVCFFFELSFVI